MTPRTYLLSLAGVVVLTMLIYVINYKHLLGAPIAAEYWLRGVAYVKTNLSSEVDRPKILFVGGSSTLFSIDTAGITKDLGRPVYNLGLHAGLPLQYLIDFAKKPAKSGDVVILIPEYGYYRRDNTNTAWFIDQVFAWDKSYFKHLALSERLKFIFQTPVKKVYESLYANALERNIEKKIPYRSKVSDEKVMSVFQAGWQNSKKTPFPERRFFRYYYNNLNDHGDMINTVGADYPTTGGYGLTSAMKQSADAWTSINDFKKYCDRNGIRLYLGFAPVMKADIVLKNIDSVTKNLVNLTEMASKYGIPYIDEPDSIFFDPKYFFDTDSHLNIEGKKLRSTYLAKKLLKI